MLVKATLCLEELEEVLMDVKCAMNNRPLCYVGGEFEEQVITPNILIRGRPSNVLEQDFKQMEADDKLKR